MEAQKASTDEAQTENSLRLIEVGKDDSASIGEEMNDGSELTFRVTEDTEVSVFHKNSEVKKVMLKNVYNDGSSRSTFYTIEQFAEIKDGVAKYTDVSEIEELFADDDTDDMAESVDDVMAAFDEPDEISEGMELTEDGETVFLIKSIRGNDATVAIWNDGRRKRKQRMDADELQSDYENGDLVVV